MNQATTTLTRTDVRKASSTSYGSVWAVVDARSAADARALLEAQYGRGNVWVVAEVR